MSDNDKLPCIEFSKTVIDGLKHTHEYLSVRGMTIEDCRKHFDEIQERVL